MLSYKVFRKGMETKIPLEVLLKYFWRDAGPETGSCAYSAYFRLAESSDLLERILAVIAIIVIIVSNHYYYYHYCYSG